MFSKQNNTVILDTGASRSLADPSTHLQHENTNTPKLKVIIPNGTMKRTASQGNFPHPTMSKAATTAHRVNNFSKSLLSIGQVCNAGYKAKFTKTKAEIIDPTTTKVEWAGKRNFTANLWELPLPTEQLPPAQGEINVLDTVLANTASTQTTLQEHVTFLHQAARNPILNRWLEAIDNNQYTTWPNVTKKNLYKHLPKSETTVLGHLSQRCKNKNKLRKEWYTPQELQALQEQHKQVQADLFPPPGEVKTFNLFMKLEELPTHQTYADKTGKFPITSSAGNKYIYV